MVLTFGFLVLGNPWTSRNLAGLCIAVLGMMAYGWAEHKDAQAKKEAANKTWDEDAESGLIKGGEGDSK